MVKLPFLGPTQWFSCAVGLSESRDGDSYVLLEDDGRVATALEEHLRRSSANRCTESLSETVYGER